MASVANANSNPGIRRPRWGGVVEGVAGQTRHPLTYDRGTDRGPGIDPRADFDWTWCLPMPTYADIPGQSASSRMADAQPDRVTMRLLVIEDDRDAADYLVKAFREVGHVADAANDGEDGLAMALDGQYDVLIVDRMLPKRDGLSVIGTLRDKGIETPALILSALGQVDDRVKGLRAGGDDYLPKPYSFSELLARVEVLARRRGSRNEETVLRVGRSRARPAVARGASGQTSRSVCSRANSACWNI